MTYAPGGKVPTYELRDKAREFAECLRDEEAAMRKFNWHPGDYHVRVFRGTYRWWVQYPIGTSGVGLKHFTTWHIAMRFADIRADYRV